MLAYLIRHAESLGNVRQSDSLNADLSPLGLQQRHALAERLAAANPVAIYCSPYQRCIDTIAPLAAQLSLPMRVRPDLCEFHHLPPETELAIELAVMDELIAANEHVIACPDWNGAFDWPGLGEAFDSLLTRTREFGAYLKERWTADESVVVVSHGSPIARLIDGWLTDARGPSFRFIIDNAAVSALRYRDGVSSLVCLNETSHLVDLPAPVGANYSDDRTIKAPPPSAYW